MTQFGRPATHPLRIVAVILYISVFILNIYYRLGDPEYSSTMIGTFTLVGGLSFLIGLEIVEQRAFSHTPPRHLVIASIISRMIITELIGLYDNSGFYRFLYMLPPVIAYLYLGRWVSYLLAILNFAISTYTILVCCDPRWVLAENDIADLILIGVGLIFAVLMARTVAMQEESQQRTEALLEELKTSQLQVASLAAVNERNRIARDIHDSVGHHLTAVNIQLERAITFQEINPAETTQALHDAKRSAKSALNDVRESVSALRDTERPFALTPALHTLISSFHTLPTTLHIEGDETDIAKPTLMALYRAAQEGLTNIEKHADATAANLSVSFHPQHATLTLEDNGTGIDTNQLEKQMTNRNAHFGLTGLRERLELLGGTLTITSQQPQGTILQIRVPAQGLT